MLFMLLLELAVIKLFFFLPSFAFFFFYFVLDCDSYAFVSTFKIIVSIGYMHLHQIYSLWKRILNSYLKYN